MANVTFKPPYVKKILVSPAKVQSRILKAAKWVAKEYAQTPQPPILLGILNGAIPFFTKLVMNIPMDVEFEFMTLSSFRGEMKAVDKPQILDQLNKDITNRDVIIVEDILDSARTMSVLVKYLKRYKPKSIRTMVLVDKPDARVIPFQPDFACFTVQGSPFLIGYGLDIKEIARNLPYIAEFNQDYIDKI